MGHESRQYSFCQRLAWIKTVSDIDMASASEIPNKCRGPAGHVCCQDRAGSRKPTDHQALRFRAMKDLSAPGLFAALRNRSMLLSSYSLKTARSTGMSITARKCDAS